MCGKLNKWLSVVTICLGASLANVANAATIYESGAEQAGDIVGQSITSTTAGTIVSRIATAVNSAVVGGALPSTPSVSPTSDAGQTSQPKMTLALDENSNLSSFSAGNEEGTTFIWGGFTKSWVESTKTTTAFDGDVDAAYFGFDTWLSEDLLAGVSLGYSNIDVDTAYNQGTYEEETISISPYAAYTFNDTYSLSGLVGYYWSDIDQDRARNSASYASSSTDVETLFAAATLSATEEFGDLTTKGNLTYIWSNRDTDGYTESDSTVVAATSGSLSQAKIGGELEYAFAGESLSWSPFVGAHYLLDFEDKINNDKDAVDANVGVKIISSDDSVSGTFEFTEQLGRDDFDLTYLSFTLRVQF